VRLFCLLRLILWSSAIFALPNFLTSDIPAMMQVDEGQTVSSWIQKVNIPSHPPLKGAIVADVCIVGAGIAGMTAAYFLCKQGKTVAVLDDGDVGTGQTARTSAHLASESDDRFTELERLHGDEGAKLFAESHSQAIETIERISHHENIDCDFKRLDALLFLGPGDSSSILDDELAAARRAGLMVEKTDRASVTGFNATGPALRFARQARFHPMKYLAGLTRAVEAMGGHIFGQSRVIDTKGGLTTKTTTASGALVSAARAVVATNTPAPINDWMGVYLKQAAYRTYIVAFRVLKNSVADMLYWDTPDPYHYVRIDPTHYDNTNDSSPDSRDANRRASFYDLLIVGGEDHKTGQGPEGDPFARLEEWARRHFPSAQEIEYRWSGQVQEPEDYLAFIGAAPTAGGNVYVATGDSGMGLTHGTIAGILISDLIAGRANPWAKLYDPTRKTLRASSEYIQENANVAAQYTKYLTPGEVSSPDQIPAGGGAILREGFNKLAVYKDASGALTKCSANCTHLGCIVHWNGIEKTWDCPCHGARYAPTGEVILGPAVEGLKRISPQ
jgi:glycine/D-amino acid oxidase-like deaminating enzyme/nitrite reductase/ring-hydroxylating ferredoxin subunit